MAKATTSGGTAKKRAAPRKAAAAKKPSSRKGTAKAKPRKAASSETGAADALVKLIESPLVADLLAVGATAALAAIAEHRFSRTSAATGKSTSKALKEAGKAAAAAMGRRLSTEIDEIRKASKKA